MKTIKKILWVLLVSNPLIIVSQDLDASEAQDLLDKAQALVQDSKMEQATPHFEEAKGYYEANEVWDKYITCLNGLARIYQYNGDSNFADSLANEALAKAEQYLPKDHLEFANTYRMFGKIEINNGGSKEGERYFNKAIEIKSKQLGDDHPDVAQLYEERGIIYAQLWSFEQALTDWEKSLKVFLKEDPKGNHVGVLYSNLAYAYAGLFDFAKGLDFSFRSIAFLVETEGEDSPYLASGYNVHGLILVALNRFEEAAEYHKKSLRIGLMEYGKNHSIVGSYQHNIGNAYLKAKKFDQALHYFRQALKTYELSGLTEGAFYALTLSNIGNVLLEQNSYDSAANYYHRAIKTIKNLKGERNSETAYNIKFLCSIYFEQGKYQEAIDSYQDALIANSLHFSNSDPAYNPKADDYLNYVEQMEILMEKGWAIQTLHKEDPSIDYLKNALNAYITCDSVIDLHRKTRVRYEDKIQNGSTSSKMYNEAVLLCNTLYQATGDTKYVEYALFFAERNLAGALMDKIAGSEAKKFNGVPDALLELEKELKSKKSEHTDNLKSALSQKDGYDTTFLSTEQVNLSIASNRLDSLQEIIRDKYFKYSELHQSHVQKVSEIRTKMKSNQGFIEYVFHEDFLFAIVLTPNTLDLIPLEADSLEYELSEITMLMSSYPTDSLIERFTRFKKTSHTIYKILMETVLEKMPEQVSHLTVIPNSNLATLPFDLLIKNAPDDTSSDDYKELNYLMKDYTFSYANSIHSALRPAFSQKAKTGSLFAFAPEYVDATESNYPSLRSSYRDKLTPLVWNTKEVDAISQYFDGEFMTGTSATEASFKASVQNHQIIHLAMHAFVDHEEPMTSKLVFAIDNDSIDDGMLHAYELFNMDLSAEMAVLSACNTGIGKYQDGEGIMSLGKAFAYAGCPSVVTSHWSVDDEATSVLMTNFYKYIAEGQAKDDALNQAKLDFLQSSHGLKTHPFFWGGFVVIGNTEPLSQDNDHLFIYTGLAILGYMILIAIRRKKRSINQS